MVGKSTQTQVCMLRDENKPRSIGTIGVNNEIGVRIALESLAHLFPVSDMRLSNDDPQGALALRPTGRARDRLRSRSSKGRYQKGG